MSTILREWRDEDADAFAAMFDDAKVMEFLLPNTGRAAIDGFIGRIKRYFADHGFGPWAVEAAGERHGDTATRPAGIVLSWARQPTPEISMVRRFLLALILGVVAACSSSNAPEKTSLTPPEPSAGSVDEARLQRFFLLMDTDHDLSLTRPEFETGKGIVFMAIDQDNSFTLTENEMRLTHEAFMKVAGQDGAIDGQEFISAEETSFEAIDANQDRAIKYPELLDYVSGFSQ